MQERIPFVNAQASSEEELGGASPIAHNIVVDSRGTVWRRPGITTYSGAPTGVIDPNGLVGLYSSIRGPLFAIGGIQAERPIYNVNASTATLMGGGIPGTGVRGMFRPTFAETDMLVAIAGGDAIEKIVLVGTGTPFSARLGGTPPNASHVIANASRLLANDIVVDPSAVRFSGIAGGTTSYAGLEQWAYGGFGTSGYFSAEVRPDPVQAIIDTLNEVFVFGKSSLQIFVPDPTVNYAPVAASEVGLTAPYSVVHVDGALFWMDHQKRFVRGDGRSFQVISDPIQLELDALTSFTDCFGFRIVEGWLDGVLFVLPTDGRAFFYQIDTGGWSQWSGWNDATSNWAPYIVSCQTRLAGQSHSIVGTTAGKIGLLDLKTTTDLGTRVRGRIETGYLNHKTDSYKHCLNVKFALRRGQSSATPGPQAQFGFRDRPGDWSAPIPLDLGASGDTEVVLRFGGLGTYRRRQWYFEFAGTDDLKLVSATEEFEVSDV